MYHNNIFVLSVCPVYAQFDASCRENKTLNHFRDRIGGTHRAREGGEYCQLCDPGSELRHGEIWGSRAETIYGGMKKNT